MTNYRRTKVPTEEEVLQQVEWEKVQIANIQKQRDLILKVEETISKKERQVNRLNALVEKYQPYYQQYCEIKLLLAEKQSENRGLSRENQLLRRQFQELIKESEELACRVRQLQVQRQAFVRERHGIERMNREIEETFKEYQTQCRIKEGDLLKQLGETRTTVTQLRGELQKRKAEAVEAQQIVRLKEENRKVQVQLVDRDSELQKYKRLNNELSVEFDKSVGKIVEFEKELNEYRRDNHQLKKTLGLVLEQEKYQKLHEKYVSKVGKVESEEQDDDEADINCSEQIFVGESSPSMSQVKY